MESLEHAIRELINKFSAENESNTPDLVLSEFLIGCLDAFNQATRRRDRWYQMNLEPGNVHPLRECAEDCPGCASKETS